MDLGLAGRVALVTGSSRGIGQATAVAFGREGARVVVTYRNDRDRAEAVADEVREAGGEAMVVHFDLASDDSIRAAVDATLERWDGIDVLVNNAVAWGGRGGRRTRRRSRSSRPTSGGPCSARTWRARCGRSSSWRRRCGPGRGGGS